VAEAKAVAVAADLHCYPEVLQMQKAAEQLAAVAAVAHRRRQRNHQPVQNNSHKTSQHYANL